jgi:hypothetical protein
MSALVLLLALCALLSLFPFVAVDAIRLLKRLASDTRGVLAAGMVDNVLSDRGDGGQCNMPRIPTGRYPAYSTTIAGTFDASGNATFEFEAERDVLFIGMSVTADDGVPLGATVSMTYCNTKYLINSSARAWAVCCDRKPIFLVGVRENKKLEFTVNGGTPDGSARITLHGFQGNGCCG